MPLFPVINNILTGDLKNEERSMNSIKSPDLLREIRQSVLRKTELSGISESEMDDKLYSLVEEAVFERVRDLHLKISDKKRLVDSVFNSLRRHDILEPLLQDPEITEIMINGPDKIFIEKNGVSKQVPLKFESREQLEDIIQRIVSRVNRSVNEAEPIVDARLPDGSRVNVVLSPVALNGPLVTIRKFSDKPLTMVNLVKMGA